MKLHTTDYRALSTTLPAAGKQLIAQYDDESIVVYQAYNRTIADFAAKNGYFGEGFGYSRMSWIKPNFLWMMYRCGWCTKDENQARVLALRLRRSYFDGLLKRAVASSHEGSHYESRSSWQEALKTSDVRLQWDPDHDPSGAPLTRRAIQLGLSGSALSGFRGDAFLAIEDITDFVNEQRPLALAGGWDELVVPSERVYPVTDVDAQLRLGLSAASAP